MEFRHLGRSGLKISEITYGNWLTHGSQVENDVATACVRAALDAGITTFDTADAYANGKAEEVLGTALKGERRASVEIFTKVYWPTGPKGPNDTGLSRKHIFESIHASLDRLQTDYVDLYQAHRYDTETPLEETMQAFADVVRQGKALYIGVSEWTAEQIRAGHALAVELGISLISSQPQYSMLWRVIEPEVVPTCAELGLSQIVWSPMAQGVLSGQVPARAGAARGIPGDRRDRRSVRHQTVHDRRRAGRRAEVEAGRRGRRPDHGAAGDRLGAAERQRGGGAGRCLAAGTGAGQRQGGRRDAARRGTAADRPGAGRCGGQATPASGADAPQRGDRCGRSALRRSRRPPAAPW